MVDINIIYFENRKMYRFYNTIITLYLNVIHTFTKNRKYFIEFTM